MASVEEFQKKVTIVKECQKKVTRESDWYLKSDRKKCVRECQKKVASSGKSQKKVTGRKVSEESNKSWRA